MMMGFGFVGLFVMLVFWGLIIAGAVWLIKSIFPGVGIPNGRGSQQHLSAPEILEHRYARGEITREQYLGMIEDLHGTGK